MIILDTKQVCKLIKLIGLEHFFKELINHLRADYEQWREYNIVSRQVAQMEHGVIELMPAWGNGWHSYKYVCGMPFNPSKKRMNVVGLGQLSRLEDGYPVLLTEMTFLTGIRTAAMSALASLYMALPESKSLSIIGTGAQSEFQVLAHIFAYKDLNKVYYYDNDASACGRFAENMRNYFRTYHWNGELIACSSVPDLMSKRADILITCTSPRFKHDTLIDPQDMALGMHINAVGGDSHGKTELGLGVLSRCNIVVEYLEQAHYEGEVQLYDYQVARDTIAGELWEIMSGAKKARKNPEDMTLFDSVGIGLNDLSTLRLVYKLARKAGIGYKLDMFPDDIEDPKDLFGEFLGHYNSFGA